MKRKSKLLLSLMSLCLSVAVLVFGVYSAMSVSYQVTGNVSYNVQDVFVKIDLSVYKSTLQNPLDLETHKGNITTIQNATSLPVADTQVIAEMKDSVETYNIETGEVINPGATLEDSYNGLDFVYGAPDVENTRGTEASTMAWEFPEDNKAWAFYIVLDITNYGEDIVNAKITNNTTGDTQNTYFEQTGGVNIPAKSGDTYGSARLVIGLAVADVTKAASGDFSYTVTVDKGEIKTGVEVTGLKINGEQQSIEPFLLGSETNTNLPSTMVEVPVGTAEIAGRSEIELDVFSSLPSYARMFVTNNDTNSNIKVNASSAYIKGNGVYKIYIDNTSTTTTQTLDLSDVSISYDKKDTLMQYDDAENYYYVEMGTYMPSGETTNEYIRWRYLTSDLTGYAQATNPNDTTNLSDLTGMYIQETYVDEYSSFSSSTSIHQVSWENSYIQESGATPDYHHTETGLEKVKANEYRASNIRKYLNLTNDDVVSKDYNYSSSSGYYGSGVQSNLCKDLNIDIDSDIIYNQITARPLTNSEGTGLYDNMKYGTSGGKVECDISYGVPYENKAGSIDDNNFDKFWLPSFYEMYKLFKDNSGANTKSSCPSRVWHTQSGSAVSYYWLRSPNSSRNNYAYVVDYSGNLGNSNVVSDIKACRAAFQIWM